MQRRCPARSRKVWGHGTVSRSDGLWRNQGAVWRKPGAVQTLQPASFKHKNNTLRLCSQQLKTNFRRLNNYIRFYLWKRKIPPMQRSDDFVGWIGGKMNRVCCGAVNSFADFPSLKWWVSRWWPTTFCGCVQNEHDHILWMACNQSTRAVGFTRKIPRHVECVKRVLKNLLKWSKKSMTHLVALGKNTLCESEQTPFSVCGRSFYCRQQQDVAFLTIV